VGRQAVVDVQLEVGAITQTVEVMGEAPLVETTKGGLGTLVESQTISELPLNGRDLAQLITFQTGVVEFGQETDVEGGKLLVVGGGRPTSNVFLMDGVAIESYNQKTPTGVSGNFLGAEGVREFRVETNAYSAEFGRSSGGIFTIATKSGTNTLHGSAFGYHRNDNLDARRWEDNKFDLEEPEFKRNQFGFSLGGPIVKDRTFYFGTYEGLRERLGRNETSTTFSETIRQDPAIDSRVRPYLALWPLPNGLIHADGRTGDYHFSFSEPTDEDYIQTRVDHQLSDHDSFFVRYTFMDSSNQGVGDFPETLIESTARNQYAALEYARIFSPTILNTFRLGFTRTGGGSLVSRELGAAPSLAFIPGSGQTLGQLSVSGVSSLGGLNNGTPGEHYTVNSLQFVNNINYSKARHAMKFGLHWTRSQVHGWLPARESGTYSFGSIDNFLYRVQSSGFRGTISEDKSKIDPFRSWRQNIIGIFFQDDIQATARITLNAGMRYEFITVPTEAHGRVSSLRGDWTTMMQASVRDIVTGNPIAENPSLRNFAPRVGFAWDMTGNGKMALRGGFGLFFAQFDNTWLRAASFRSPPFLIEHEATQNIPFPNIAQLCGGEDPFNPQNPQCVGRPIAEPIAFKFRTPYLMQYNLNIQREIARNTVMTLGYAGSRGVKIPGVSDINAHPAQEIGGRLVFPTSLTGRPNRNFDVLRFRTPGGNTTYSSMQLNLTHKYAQGLQLSGSYTFSRATHEIGGLATASDTDTGPGVYSNYHHRAELNKGLSVFDSRHVATFNSTYELPFGSGKRFGGGLNGPASWLIAGWQLGGIVTLSAGFPSDMSVSSKFGSLGHTGERPDLVPGASNNPNEGTFQGCALFPVRADRPAGMALGGPDLFFDPCAFAPPPPRTIGNVGRNTLILPGRATIDVTLSKSFRLTEGGTLQFRFEGFNFLNKPGFRPPSRGVFDAQDRPTANPGRITSTLGTARQLQFGLKYTF
jgi:hypothetical protein